MDLSSLKVVAIEPDAPATGVNNVPGFRLMTFVTGS
jgi:hypothetical protein